MFLVFISGHRVLDLSPLMSLFDNLLCELSVIIGYYVVLYGLVIAERKHLTLFILAKNILVYYFSNLLKNNRENIGLVDHLTLSIEC